MFPEFLISDVEISDLLNPNPLKSAIKKSAITNYLATFTALFSLITVTFI